MLLDEYTVKVIVPGDSHFLDEEFDQMLAKIDDVPGIIENAIGNYVKERLPDATVEVK